MVQKYCFIFFCFTISNFPNSIYKDSVCSTMCIFGIFNQNQMTGCAWTYIRLLNITPLINVSGVCLHYHSIFVMYTLQYNLKLWMVLPPAGFLLLTIVLSVFSCAFIWRFDGVYFVCVSLWVCACMCLWWLV